jgi:O-methyltransferase involved in polyketide biosynthesis
MFLADAPSASSAGLRFFTRNLRLQPRELRNFAGFVTRQAFRVSHAARARLAEDVAAAGLASGRRDYVLLGAGLDTFAWRHPRVGDFVVSI